MRVDVDAHVDETDATWDYLAENDRRFKPVTLDPGAPTATGRTRQRRAAASTSCSTPWAVTASPTACARSPPTAA